MKIYCGAHYFTSGGHNARECTNESVNFRKLEMNARNESDACRWEKSTVSLADTVLCMCEEIKLESENLHASFWLLCIARGARVRKN